MPGDRITTLHICETAQGGVGSYVRHAATAARGFADAVAVVPAPHTAMIGDAARLAPFRHRRRGLVSTLRMIAAARRAARRHRPDVIFCHSSFSIAALAALRLSRVRARYVFCSHGWASARDTGALARGVARQLERAACRMADVVVCISRHERAHAERHRFPGRHVTIENAVPAAAGPRLARRSGTGPLRLLFVGRLDRQKGADLLLEAFRAARAVRPDLELHLAGDAVVAGSGAAPGTDGPGIVRLGWVAPEGIDAHYAAADLVVMPSRWEGFGLVAIEAFRNGTPVLASRRGALPDIVEDGRTGYLVAPEVPALRDALLALDREALAALRPGCLAAYEARYALPRFAADLDRLYSGSIPVDRPRAGLAPEVRS